MEILKEIYDYREMIASLVRRELRGKYKASILGFLWSFVMPLCQLLIYTIVFSVIMRSGIEKYYLFLFVALVPWTFCSTCITAGAGCMVAQQGMVTKIYFPREVIPISFVTSAFINMLYGYVVVFAVCIFSGVHFSVLGLLLLPVIMLIEYSLVLGLTLIFSAVTVYLRDMENILAILSMAWMFLTPIMYSIDQVPEELRRIFRWNPMTAIMDGYRAVMYWGSIPDMKTLVYPAVFAVFVLIIGFVVFGRLKRHFAEEM